MIPFHMMQELNPGGFHKPPVGFINYGKNIVQINLAVAFKFELD
jgi:hypothetical protein